MTRRPFWTTDGVTLYTGDAVDVLAELPAGSVDCVVSSPPYWGLRDYGTGRWVGGDPQCRHATGRGSNIAQTKYPAADTYPPAAAHRGGHPSHCQRCGARRLDRQIGLEPDPESYIGSLRAVFDQLRRVVAHTATVWLNLGDCYSTAPPHRAGGALPPRKNLIGMPWRVALALQRDGWILRNAIIWHKPNAMPESVTDRVSNRYETIFLLAKQPRYHFDLDPIRIPLTRPEAVREGIRVGGPNTTPGALLGGSGRRRGSSVYGAKYGALDDGMRGSRGGLRPTGHRHDAGHSRGKNPGDVWRIPTRPLRAAHFAPFPVDIPLRCIAAGCPEGGTVLDPFSGAATTGLATLQLGRSYIGIDLKTEFNLIAKRRLSLHDPQDRSAAA